MKKLMAMILAAIMVLTMSATVFAATGTNAAPNTNGSITISNAVVGQTYSVYKMADLESYDTEGNKYSYKIVDAWKDFFTTGTYVAKFSVDKDGYILGNTLAEADMAAFAKAALQYAKANNIKADATKEATSEDPDAITTTVEFTGLNLGYYLVDTTLGTVCSINTTDTNAAIEEKNEIPVVTKEVKEDSTGEWGETNTADIGQTVEFKSTIQAKTGAQAYILHDKMSAGLTYNSVTSVTLNGVEVGAANYTVKTEGLTDDCTFEVVFTQAFCDTLVDGDKIIVYYNATLNKDAVIAGDGNPNEIKLTYGENSNYETLPDKTITYTYEFDLVKTDVENNLLDGAEFKLYLKDSDEAFNLVKVSDGVYRVATADDQTTTDTIVVTGGKAVVSGLDSGEYELEETKAPTGYNKLTARVEFEIKNANLEASISENKYQSGGVEVENKTGVELPSTGGAGTLAFTIVGLVLVLGAGVLLVTKKRMSKIAG